jgi:hypothetical protein
MNYFRPLNHGMDNYHSGVLYDGSDVAFCNAILMVGINSTKIDWLMIDSARFTEGL